MTFYQKFVTISNQRNDTMETIEYDQIQKKGRLIGIGTSAKCYKNGDKVIKLFFDYFCEDFKLEDKSVFEFYSLLCNIHIDSFITPEKIITKDSKIIGYICPFIEGKTLRKLRNIFTIEDVLKRYDKIVSDNENLSKYKFNLIDIHDKNIIVNDRFNVIDLDRGFIDVISVEKLKEINLQKINQSIIDSLFKVRYIDELIFFSDKMNELYYDLKNPDNMLVLLEEFLKNDDKTIKFKTLRKKVNYEKRYNEYKK